MLLEILIIEPVLDDGIESAVGMITAPMDSVAKAANRA